LRATPICSRAASPRSPPDASAARDEIADVVTYLATTPATFLQGHNLVVDGGFIIH